MVQLGLVSEPGRGGRRGNQHEPMADSAIAYSRQAADSLGVSERTLRQDLARGKKIAPEVMAEVEGTRLDKGVVLDELAVAPLAAFRCLTDISRDKERAADSLNLPRCHIKFFV